MEYVIISALSKAMGADPAEEAKAHMELSERYLQEAASLEDPVQAAEKGYKRRSRRRRLGWAWRRPSWPSRRVGGRRLSSSPP